MKQKTPSKTVMVLVPNDDIAVKLKAWIEAYFLIRKYQDNLQVPWLMQTCDAKIWDKAYSHSETFKNFCDK